MLFKSTAGAFFMFDLQYGTSNASQADQNRMPSLMYVRLETIYAIRASARASSSFASQAVTVKGFSQITCFPASNAFFAYS